MIPEQFKEFKFCLCCVYIDTHQNEDIKIVLVPERAFSLVLFFKDTFDESTVCVCVCVQQQRSVTVALALVLKAEMH